MSVRLEDNTKLLEHQIKVRANIFLRKVADEIVSRSEPNTPKKTGSLRRSTLKTVNGLKGRVEWRKAYAARLEEKRFRNYTTPGTGPHYAEDAVRATVKDTKIIARRARLI